MDGSAKFTMDLEKGKAGNARLNLLEGFTDAQRRRWQGKEFLIQPMTEGCGSWGYLGDIYARNKIWKEWEAVDNPGPYLQYVRKAALHCPRLDWLKNWMEATSSPLRWKFLEMYQGDKDGHRNERACRTNATVINYFQQLNGSSGVEPTASNYQDHVKLRTALDTPVAPGRKQHARLVIVEDLSREVIEVLGSTYDIDPDFFRSHIEDYIYYKLEYTYAEIPKLTSSVRQHFCIQNLRGRYFQHEDDFLKAQEETGMFNVQRRLDSDRIAGLRVGQMENQNAFVALTRAKTSVWVSTKDAQPLTVVLLVDPSIQRGHACWSGNQPFEQVLGAVPWKVAKDFLESKNLPISLFDQVNFWQGLLSSDTIELAKQMPKFIALPTYQMIVADWLVSIQYMATTVATIEWNIENRLSPGESPEGVDLTRKTISPWRRNIVHYQDMIQDMHDNLFDDPSHPDILDSAQIPETSRNTLRALRHDLLKAQRQIQEIRLRTEKIEDLVNNENNAEAFRQNRSIGRLTILATLFLPLNFAATFLSMQTEFSAQSNSFWLFFAIGFPFMALVGLGLLVSIWWRDIVFWCRSAMLGFADLPTRRGEGKRTKQP